jgi:hypothetical protein
MSLSCWRLRYVLHICQTLLPDDHHSLQLISLSSRDLKAPDEKHFSFQTFILATTGMKILILLHRGLHLPIQHAH